MEQKLEGRCLSPFLRTGTMLALIQSLGKEPEPIESWKILDRVKR